MKDRDDTASAAEGRPPEALTPGQRHGWVIAARHLRLGDAGYSPAEAGEIVEAIMAAWPPT